MALLLASLAGAILLLLYILRRAGSGKEKRGRRRGRAVKTPGAASPLPPPAGATRCPVCAEVLEEDQALISKALPASGGASGVRGRVLYIAGCPNCVRGQRPRACPVCGAALGVGEDLYALMFATKGKPRVEITGCGRCGVQAKKG